VYGVIRAGIDVSAEFIIGLDVEVGKGFSALTHGGLIFHGG
jgi:hypothetical protein